MKANTQHTEGSQSSYALCVCISIYRQHRPEAEIAHTSHAHMLQTRAHSAHTRTSKYDALLSLRVRLYLLSHLALLLLYLCQLTVRERRSVRERKADSEKRGGTQ